nr:probable sulfate transporter 3.5 [Tanacetum cinerariifolium]
MDGARPVSNILNKAHSHVRRPFKKFTTNKNSTFNQKVNIVKGNVTTVGSKAAVSDKKGNEANVVKEKGVIDSGCSRHMIGNMSYLSEYKKNDGGYVSFGGNPQRGREGTQRNVFESLLGQNKDAIFPRNMDVKSAFPYDIMEEEVYVCQPSIFEDPHFLNKVEKALYGLHQAPRACQDKYVADILKKIDMDVDVHLYRSMIGSLMYLTASRPDIIYLKGQPKLDLWYPKDSPFDWEAFLDSDYAGASLDRKSIIGGCQFLKKRLISWQCKKQTLVANSTTKEEYVSVANCCGQFTKFVKQRKPKLFWVSAIAPMIVVIVGCVFSYLAHAEKHGIAIVGQLNKGINPSSLKKLDFDTKYVSAPIQAGIVTAMIALAVSTPILAKII